MTSHGFDKYEREQARKELREMLPPGSTVHVIQRHVARSGMMRHLSLKVIGKDGSVRDITYKAAAAMGDKVYDGTQNTNDWVLHVGGSGMDMHFYTVYSLSRSLYPEGHQCTGRHSCQSNDHTNDYGAGQQMWREHLAKEGIEEISYHVEGGPEQHEQMRAFTENLMENGPLGYGRDRMHGDGGYALKQVTL